MGVTCSRSAVKHPLEFKVDELSLTISQQDLQLDKYRKEVSKLDGQVTVLKKVQVQLVDRRDELEEQVSVMSGRMSDMKNTFRSIKDLV